MSILLAGWLAGCGSTPLESSPLVHPLPDGGAQTLPEACRVASSATTPLSTTFRVKNTGAQTLYYHQGCAPRFDVASCAASYMDQVADRGGLYCSCEQTPNCPVGGPCGFTGLAIAPGATIELSWRASIHVTKMKGAYSCSDQQHLPPGKYRFSFPLYATRADARPDNPPLMTVTKDFELTGPSGVVDVEFAR
jgi:hypothetical protein